MSAAIVLSVVIALLLGGASGFRSRWKESFLLSSLAIPLGASTGLAAWLGGVSSPGWMFLTFVWAFLGASLAWGLAAGIRHLASREFEKEESRSP